MVWITIRVIKRWWDYGILFFISPACPIKFGPNPDLGCSAHWTLDIDGDSYGSSRMMNVRCVCVCVSRVQRDIPEHPSLVVIDFTDWAQSLDWKQPHCLPLPDKDLLLELHFCKHLAREWNNSQIAIAQYTLATLLLHFLCFVCTCGGWDSLMSVWKLHLSHKADWPIPEAGNRSWELW